MITSRTEEGRVLDRLQNVWENYAKDDPLWAIISTPGKMGGKWNLEEFLRTGRHEIEQLLETLALNDIEIQQDSALDFGCGVGRLTQALAQHFESVCGVDISPTMIENANRLNQFPAKCTYHVNAEQNLMLFEDKRFSFVYSNMVLQHMSPDFAREYLAEFGRILRPGGLLVFQLPSLRRQETGLPPTAWKTSIQCLQEEFSLPPSARVTLEVSVHNVSSAKWRYEPQQPIMLGNHWLDDAGQMIRMDDGRTQVPNALRPGEKVNLTLEVRTPPEPGSYLLELDLVEEGVAWFKEKGARTLKLPVEIVSEPVDPAVSTSGAKDLPAPAPSAPGALPEESFEGFSMHCIPRHEVVDLLYRHGMRLEFIAPSAAGGPGYQSYTYFARNVEAPQSGSLPAVIGSAG